MFMPQIFIYIVAAIIGICTCVECIAIDSRYKKDTSGKVSAVASGILLGSLAWIGSLCVFSIINTILTI